MEKFHSMEASEGALWEMTVWHLKLCSDGFHQLKFLYFRINSFCKIPHFWFPPLAWWYSHAVQEEGHAISLDRQNTVCPDASDQPFSLILSWQLILQEVGPSLVVVFFLKSNLHFILLILLSNYYSQSIAWIIYCSIRNDISFGWETSCILLH